MNLAVCDESNIIFDPYLTKMKKSMNSEKDVQLKLTNLKID